MLYEVMLTFDLKAFDKYEDLNKTLKDELGVSVSFEKDGQEYHFPKNTYFAKFSDEKYESKEALTIFLTNKLKKIFGKLNVNGSCAFLIDKTEESEVNGNAFEF
jgi:hypothetical protein